jgi:hypothetical protein
MKDAPAATTVSVSNTDIKSTFMKKMIHYIGREEMKNQIKYEIIDPLLNHIMKRVFPYIILTCVLFILLLFAVLLTLGIIIFQFRAAAVPASAAMPVL